MPVSPHFFRQVCAAVSSDAGVLLDGPSAERAEGLDRARSCISANEQQARNGLIERVQSAGMDIKDFLSPEAVFELRETDKGRVLKDLARRAAALLDTDPETITKAIFNRENLGSTGLGNGVALPHARIGDLEKPFGVFALLKPAVQFDAIDERPVDLVFLLLLPERLPEGQLKAMACVARRLRDPILAGQLRGVRAGVSLYALLTEP